MPGTNQWYIDRPDEAKHWVVDGYMQEQLAEKGFDFDENHNRCHSFVTLHCLVVLSVERLPNGAGFNETA